MSGGHYDYKCFDVSRFAEMVQMDIHAFSEPREIRHSPEYVEKREALPKPLLDKMQVFVDIMRKCSDMAKDIEWLMTLALVAGIIMILRSGTYSDLRIELTVEERSRPYRQLIDEMKTFLVEQFGADKAATFEHVSVSDPGFAHFRKVRAV